MMLFVDLLLVLAVTVILTAVFAAGFARRRFGSGLLAFFMMLFLATWAIGLWIVPIGPPLGGRTWVPFVLVGLFAALFLVAVTPPHHPFHPLRRTRTVGSGRSDAQSSVLADIGFWVLVAASLAAIVLAYVLD